MKLSRILVLTFCFIWSLSSFGQTISTNEHGETIVQFDDGSWRYYDENDEYDQFLMKKHLDTLRSKGEEKTPATVLAIPSIKEGIKQIDVLNLKVTRAKIAFEDAQDEKQVLQDQIKRYKKVKNKLKVNALKSLLKKKNIEIKERKKYFKIAKSQVANYQRELKKAKKKKKKESILPIDEENSSTQKEEKEQHQKVNSNKKEDYAKYSIDNDVMFHPPAFPCEFLPSDEKQKSKLAPQKLFSYSPSAMVENIDRKNNDFIYCTGQISKVKGGNMILNLVITIASENAKNEFGLIEKGSMMIFNMVDKSSVSVRSRKTTIGRSNEVDKSVTYEASYSIPSGFVKKLKSLELDKVKIIWSTGYEEYEIYETDFFMNLLNCFE